MIGIALGFTAKPVGVAQAQPGLGGSGSINGRITFTDGSPAVNRVVEWRPNGNPDGGSTVQTGANGGYTIKGLRDGEYFVGYFQPSRLPAGKNPGVEVSPDPASEELTAIGKPLVRRVHISQGAAVAGIDFVITNIGNEQVEGPSSRGGAPPSELPDTGASAAPAPRGDSPASLLWTVSAAAVLGALLVAGIGWARVSRRRSR